MLSPPCQAERSRAGLRQMPRSLVGVRPAPVSSGSRERLPCSVPRLRSVFSFLPSRPSLGSRVAWEREHVSSESSLCAVGGGAVACFGLHSSSARSASSGLLGGWEAEFVR